MCEVACLSFLVLVLFFFVLNLVPKRMKTFPVWLDARKNPETSRQKRVVLLTLTLISKVQTVLYCCCYLHRAYLVHNYLCFKSYFFFFNVLNCNDQFTMVNVNFEEHFEFLLLLFSLTEVQKNRHGRRHWSRIPEVKNNIYRFTKNSIYRFTKNNIYRFTKNRTRILCLNSKASRLFSFPVKKTVPTRSQDFWIWQLWRPSRGIPCYLLLASSLKFSIRIWQEHYTTPFQTFIANHWQSNTSELRTTKVTPRKKGNTLYS